jgi:hypothetical protein
MIKVCIDPQCEEVAHNCENKETHCRSCNGRLIAISVDQYSKKFKNNFFQYDYTTGELYRPKLSTNGKEKI